MSLYLDADLRSVFSWNTKQLFVYLQAEYSTPQNHLNEVVLWDQIVQRKEEAHVAVGLAVCRAGSAGQDFGQRAGVLQAPAPRAGAGLLWKLPGCSRHRHSSVTRQAQRASVQLAGWSQPRLHRPLQVRNLRQKYPFIDQGKNLRSRALNLTLVWNVMPKVGGRPGAAAGAA
jgi:hypothetical protein